MTIHTRHIAAGSDSGSPCTSMGYELIRRRDGSEGADLLNLLISTELSDVETRDELVNDRPQPC